MNLVTPKPHLLYQIVFLDFQESNLKLVLIRKHGVLFSGELNIFLKKKKMLLGPNKCSR